VSCVAATHATLVSCVAATHATLVSCVAATHATQLMNSVNSIERSAHT